MFKSQLLTNKYLINTSAIKNMCISTCFNPNPKQNPFNKYIIAAIIATICFIMC